MKILTDKKELKSLNACSSGYRTFIEAHGDNTITLSQCLESNGWTDTWWLISRTCDQFSDNQKLDLRLLACDYALLCIDNFEREYPKDNHPRLAIEASIAFTKKKINSEELSIAELAAESAVELARSTTWSTAQSTALAAQSTAWAAHSAARLAAWSTAQSIAESIVWVVAESINTKMLMDLFIKWEIQFNDNSK